MFGTFSRKVSPSRGCLSTPHSQFAATAPPHRQTVERDHPKSPAAIRAPPLNHNRSRSLWKAALSKACLGFAGSVVRGKGNLALRHQAVFLCITRTSFTCPSHPLHKPGWGHRPKPPCPCPEPRRRAWVLPLGFSLFRFVIPTGAAPEIFRFPRRFCGASGVGVEDRATQRFSQKRSSLRTLALQP